MGNQSDNSDSTAARARLRRQDKKRGPAQSIREFLLENEWFWGSIFLILVFLIFTRHFRVQPPPNLPLGAVASKDIRAPFDLQIVDEVATKKKREEARAKVVPVFDWDSQQPQILSEKVHTTFEKARSLLKGYREQEKSRKMTRAERKEADRQLMSSLEDAFGGGISRFAIRQFLREDFSEKTEGEIENVLKQVASRKIAADMATLRRYPVIHIRDIRKSNVEWEQNNPSQSDILSMSEASRLPGTLLSLLQPNLTFNSQETAKRQDAAAEQVEPLVVYIQKGQMILQAGQKVDDSALQKIHAFRRASRKMVNVPLLVSLFLFLLLLLIFTFMYLKSYRKIHYPELNLFVLVIQITIIFLLLSQFMLYFLGLFADSAKTALFSRTDLTVFLIPVAAGAMVVTFLVDKHIGVIYSIFFAIFFGVLLDFNFQMTLFAILSSFTAIYAAQNLAQRSAQWKASLLIGGVNMALAAAILANDPIWEHPVHLLYPLSLAFAAGFPLTTMIVSPVVPLFENAYGILTELRLLELSSMNHPLLRRLAIDAPGTYNHSIMMSTLSEAAANAIGANGLFCRVACYYHDIGKLLNPVYFVENQVPGQNPHDKLTPRISALIVAAHIKEGKALGRQYGLPQAVVDIIPQHHGTRKISYFYDKAMTIVDPEKESLNEADFQYPGPKPRSREAAIIMLTDGVEAASRVLREPSPQRIRTLISEIVAKVVKEEQLDESNLTFSDLALVQDAFYQILIGVFSRRISYPGYKFDKEEGGRERERSGPDQPGPRSKDSEK
ncbi:MAG: HDIG domain-containing protein [Acidobacteriota bacterium]